VIAHQLGKIHSTHAWFVKALLNTMKKPYTYEAVAALTGILGVFVLVSGLMPFINPEFVDLNEAKDYSPKLAFLVPTLLSLPILGAAWHFNKKAQDIRRGLKKNPSGKD
jgi:hypothetical protein